MESEQTEQSSASLEGYVGQLSLGPGEQLTLHLSRSQPGSVAASICDLVDPKRSAVPSIKSVNLEVVPRYTQRGSFFERVGLEKASAHSLNPSPGKTIWAFVYPTLRCVGGQSIVSLAWPHETMDFGLDSDGCPAWTFGEQAINSDKPLDLHTWHLLVVELGETENTLTQLPVVDACNGRTSPHLVDQSVHRTMGQGSTDMPAADSAPETMRIGASGQTFAGGSVESIFTGKIGPVGICDGPMDHAWRAENPIEVDNGTVALWDSVPGGGPSDPFESQGPNRLVERVSGLCNLEAVNNPVALMTGPNWTGQSDHWRLVPEQYCANRYGAQVVTDCNWPVTHTFDIPSDIASGAYSVRLESSGTVQHLPFFVTPDKTAGTNRTPLAVVLPTMSYIAEGGQRPATMHASVPTPINPIDPSRFVDYGGSTLDTGSDQAGVSIASSLRPLPELSPDLDLLDLPTPARFSQDLAFLGFLRSEGIAFDVLTDEQLDTDGASCLKPYRAISTGCYPAYASRRMLDAWEGYATGGGRIMYLGGGGFYWLASYSPDRTMVEVRRGESGSRTWQAEPGEFDHTMENERCGLWRTKGRPPQKVFGVGLAADGRSVGTAYQRMPDSFHKSVSWVFDKVAGETFGEPNSSCRLGAAAFELDRYDLLLSSPPHTRILASASRLGEEYLRVVEEVLFNHPGLSGAQEQQVRGDMVLFTTPNNGAVFAAGSSAWSRAVVRDRDDVGPARITKNVLHAFLKSGRLKGSLYYSEDHLV